MKGDFTRWTYREKRHYRKVLMQQGRVQVDADWNEQLAIDQHYERTSLRDIIGRTGTTINPDGGFRIMPLTAPSTAGDFGISPGRYYVDGLLCENDSDAAQKNTPPALNASQQEDLPPIPVPHFVIQFENIPQNPNDLVNFIQNMHPNYTAIQNMQFTLNKPNNTILTGSATDGSNNTLTLTLISNTTGATTGATLAFSDTTQSSDSFSVSIQNNVHILRAAGNPVQLPPTFSGVSMLPKSEGNFLVFLDVWERHVTALEDSYIKDTALLGADTGTRAKIVWQVKVLQGQNSCSSGSLALNDLTPKSLGSLQARARPTQASVEPCNLPPEAGYQGLQNQLYRVEIHDPGQLGIGKGPAPTFKWSRDNGTVVSKILDIEEIDSTHTQLSVDSTERNTENLSFQPGQWVEVTDDRHELWGLPGVFVKLTKVQQNTLTFDPTAASSNYPINLPSFPRNPKVRRWDHDPASKRPIICPITVKRDPSTNYGYVELENGVEICFGDGNYQTGDFWLIRASTATADVEWPVTVSLINFETIPSNSTSLMSFLNTAFGAGGWFPTSTQPFMLDATGKILTGSVTDKNGPHPISITLNNEETLATLREDGTVIYAFPVVIKEGDHILQGSNPKQLPRFGIEHHYAPLAILNYSGYVAEHDVALSNRLQSGSSPGALVSATPTTQDAPSANDYFSLAINPQSATIAPGGSTEATLTLTPKKDDWSSLSLELSYTVSPSGPILTLPTNPLTLYAEKAQTVQLNVQTPEATAQGIYNINVAASSQYTKKVGTVSVPFTLNVKAPILDCRNFFAPLSDLIDFYYAGGDGQEAAPQAFLAAPVQAGVSIAGMPLQGMYVRFTTKTGNLTKSQPLGGIVSDIVMQSISVETGSDGIARCYWTLGPQNGLLTQQVEAVLLDSSQNPIGAPTLFYNATLPTNFFYVSGDGHQATPETSIKIQAGVLIGADPPTRPSPSTSGVQYNIQFSVTLGNGNLSIPTDPTHIDQSPSSTAINSTGTKTLRVQPDSSTGIATCIWTLDKQAAQTPQQAQAVLMVSFDGGKNWQKATIQPVYFNAFAAQVSG